MRSRNSQSHKLKLAAVVMTPLALLFALVVSGGCGGIAVDTSANRIYVANFGNGAAGDTLRTPTHGNVTVIDGTTNSTTAIDLGLAYPNPVAVAVDPASQSMRRKRMTAPGTAREEHEAMEFSVKKSALQI